MDEKKRKMLYAASGVGIVLLVVFYWLFFASFSSSKAASYVYIDKDDTIDSVYVKLNQTAKPRQMVGLKICATLMGHVGK